jgi:hypothetical protein
MVDATSYALGYLVDVNVAVRMELIMMKLYPNV